MNNLIKEYCTAKGLKKSSIQTVTYMLEHYERFQEATLEELILEAEQEEDAGIRWKHRKLKKRLINYTNHLQETMMYSSAKVYLLTAKAFYNHFEIEVHQTPPLNKKTVTYLYQSVLKTCLIRILSDKHLKSQHHYYNP